jgi:hypothetical protein
VFCKYNNELPGSKEAERGLLDHLSSFKFFEMKAAPGNYIVSKISVRCITVRE